MRSFKVALAFLTIVPVRFDEGEVTDDDLAHSRFAYPLVGLTIGLFLASLNGVLSLAGGSQAVVAFVLIAAGAILTGGLHLDGLADTADGLFLWGDRERRLAVMRDPHVGSYGTTAVVLVLLGKYAALSGLTGSTRGWAVLVAAVVSRALVLVSAGMADYARREGTGRVLIDAVTERDSHGAAAVVITVSIVGGGLAGLVAASLTLGWAWGLTRMAKERLEGVTGDTLGALVETGELIVLLAFGFLGSMH